MIKYKILLFLAEVLQFELKRVCFSFSATLLVAINEIKKSAHKHGVSFYEYGMHILHLIM